MLPPVESGTGTQARSRRMKGRKEGREKKRGWKAGGKQEGRSSLEWKEQHLFQLRVLALGQCPGAVALFRVQFGKMINA